jgi:hypothetical protein
VSRRATVFVSEKQFWKILEFWQGRPDAWCFYPDNSNGRPDYQFTLFFVSFPMTPISSQSDIWPKSYNKNTRQCSDGLIERPNDQLQPPFQNSTESFHNKAVSGRCCPSVWTVVLRLHVITIIGLWASGTWRLMSGRLNWCMQFPFLMLDRPDHEDWRPDGWTLYARLALWRTSSWRDHTSFGRLQPSFHNCVLKQKP